MLSVRTPLPEYEAVLGPQRQSGDISTQYQQSVVGMVCGKDGFWAWSEQVAYSLLEVFHNIFRMPYYLIMHVTVAC